MPAGRPCLYTPELGEEICRLLSGGQSLRKICALEDMPEMTTILRWVCQKEEFRVQYDKSREMWSEREFDGIIDLADDVSIPADQKRIMVDTRKWALARMMPKRFGDRMTQELTGAGGTELVVTVRSVLDKGKE